MHKYAPGATIGKGRPRGPRASGPAGGASQQAVFGGGVVWKARWGRTRGVKHTRGAGHPNQDLRSFEFLGGGEALLP